VAPPYKFHNVSLDSSSAARASRAFCAGVAFGGELGPAHKKTQISLQLMPLDGA